MQPLLSSWKGRKTRILFALMMLVTLLLTACGGGENTSGANEITYRYPDFVNVKDLQAVEDELNKLVQEKIGAKINLEPIPGGSYEQKMKLLYSARQTCDIVFTAPWINNFYQGVDNGNYLALDDLLPQHAPNLYQSMPATTWNAARVDGKIYAVINQQIFVKPWGVLIRKDLAEKYNLDLDSIKTMSELEPFMEQVKQDGITPIIGSQQGTGMPGEFHGWDTLNDNYHVSIKANDSSMEVFANYEQPETMGDLQLTRKWREAGYFTKDELQASEADAQFKAGKYAMLINQVIKPGGNLEAETKYGYPFIQKSLTNPILTTAGVAATMNAVCRTSKNPEAAMKFLNLLNTDKTVYNTLAKGVEGKHWEFINKEEEIIAPPEGQTPAYSPTSDWMFGNQFNAYYTDEAQVGSWEATKKLNDEAEPSVALGFAFDQNPVKTQMAQCKAVGDDFKALSQGRLDIITEFPKYVARLKEAGIDQIKEEMQKQLNNWKQKNT